MEEEPVIFRSFDISLDMANANSSRKNFMVECTYFHAMQLEPILMGMSLERLFVY